MDWSWIVYVAAVFLAVTWFFRRDREPQPPPYKFHLGDVTLETLEAYAGWDFSKPILIAIKGKVYDVSKAGDVYGPNKPLHKYAGREVARALAKDSTAEEDLGTDAVHDLSAEEAERLAQKITEFEGKFEVVGQVVPLKRMDLSELGRHDGSDPSRPLLLSIRGVIFDVSKGRMFYGPDGVYPFAGRECARALALISTEVKDCNADIADLGYAEQQTLREWEGKFRSKYPVVGSLVN